MTDRFTDRWNLVDRSRSPKIMHARQHSTKGTNTFAERCDAQVQNILSREDDLMLEQALKSNLSLEEENKVLRD